MSDRIEHEDKSGSVVIRCQNAERWRWNWSQVISVVVILLGLFAHYMAMVRTTSVELGRHDVRITNNAEHIKVNTADIRDLSKTKADKK